MRDRATMIALLRAVRRRSNVVLLAVLAGALSVSALPAEASFPGDNGPIFFSGIRDGSTPGIFRIDPDGTDTVRVTPPGALTFETPSVSADGERMAVRGC